MVFLNNINNDFKLKMNNYFRAIIQPRHVYISYFNLIRFFLLLLTSWLWNGSLAQPVVSFLAPDTVCVNEPVSITNQSVGASKYFWSFCSGNLSTQPSVNNLGNINNSLELPVFMDFAYFNGNYYGFIVNHKSGKLTRLNFGNSLLNTPTTTIISLPAAILPSLDGAEDIQIIENEGKWYGIMVAGYPPTGYSPRIIRLEFGTDLDNPNPIATNWGNIGNMLQPIGFHMFQDGANWYGFTVNAENNSITRFNFTNSFDNTPTAINLGNIGNMAYPTSIYAINNNGTWQAFVLNAGNNTTTSGNFSITRLDFGNSLLNTPTGVNIGNPNGVLKHPRDFTILKSCGETVGFAINGMPGTYDLVKLDFNNNLNSTPVGSSFGNIGGFNFPHSISKIFRTGENLYAFVTNVANNTLSRIEFTGCANASIPNSTLASPPAYTYNTPGTYTISLLVDEGLPTQTAFCKTITVVAPPVSVLPNDTTICEQQILDLVPTVNNGLNYQWSTGSTASSIAISVSGKYWLDMITSSGCAVSDTIQLEISSSPIFSFGTMPGICNGDTRILDAPVTGQSYTWSTGETTSSISIQTGGAYHLTITDGNCSFGDTVVIEALPSPLFSLGLDKILCPKESALLIPDITNYTEYLWSDGTNGTSLQIAEPGLYWVEARSNEGCRFRDSVLVNAVPDFNLDLGDDQTACEPSTFTLSATPGGTSYSWNTGAHSETINVDQTGTYYVDVKKDGCDYSDTITIVLNPLPLLVVPDTVRACKEEIVTLSAISNSTELAWSTGQMGNSIEISRPETYTVTAALNGCTTTANIIVTEDPIPSVSLGEDGAICDGEFLQINPAITNGNFLEWADGYDQAQRTIQSPGVYTLVAENRCGTAADTIVVKPGSEKSNLYQLANAFTPNGDGKNDCFGINNWLIREVKEFSIYNRWGRLVFSGNNTNKCWNGVYNGTLQETGAYVYIVRVETYCGSINQKGLVMLLK